MKAQTCFLVLMLFTTIEHGKPSMLVDLIEEDDITAGVFAEAVQKHPEQLSQVFCVAGDYSPHTTLVQHAIDLENNDFIKILLDHNALVTKTSLETGIDLPTEIFKKLYTLYEAESKLDAENRMKLANELLLDAAGTHAPGEHEDLYQNMIFLVEEKKADLNTQSESGVTPFYRAAKKRYHDLALYLLQKGADPLIVPTKEESILHILRAGSFPEEMKKIVCHILKNHPTLLNAHDADDKTPLDWALENREMSLAKIFLEYGGRQSYSTPKPTPQKLLDQIKSGLITTPQQYSKARGMTRRRRATDHTPDMKSWSPEHVQSALESLRKEYARTSQSEPATPCRVNRKLHFDSDSEDNEQLQTNDENTIVTTTEAKQDSLMLPGKDSIEKNITKPSDENSCSSNGQILLVCCGAAATFLLFCLLRRLLKRRKQSRPASSRYERVTTVVQAGQLC